MPILHLVSEWDQNLRNNTSVAAQEEHVRQTKLREGNVFIGVCLSTEGRGCRSLFPGQRPPTQRHHRQRTNPRRLFQWFCPAIVLKTSRFIRLPRDTVNRRAVWILLECILISIICPAWQPRNNMFGYFNGCVQQLYWKRYGLLVFAAVSSQPHIIYDLIVLYGWFMQ